MKDASLRFLAVIASLFSIWVVMTNVRNTARIKHDNQIIVDSLIKSSDSIRYLKDSLNNELFIQSTNVVRYEIALERLREEDSSLAKIFENKLSGIE